MLQVLTIQWVLAMLTKMSTLTCTISNPIGSIYQYIDRGCNVDNLAILIIEGVISHMFRLCTYIFSCFEYIITQIDLAPYFIPIYVNHGVCE